MGKGFKNAMCNARPAGDGGHLSDLARRGCIRKPDHPPPCRNRVAQWWPGDDEVSPRSSAPNVDAMLERLAGAMRLAALGDDRMGKPVHHHVVGCWVRTVQAIREALKVAGK